MLRCTSNYRAMFRDRIVEFTPGKVIDDAELEAHLRNDSPSSFEAVTAAPEPDPIIIKPVADPAEHRAMPRNRRKE